MFEVQTYTSIEGREYIRVNDGVSLFRDGSEGDFTVFIEGHSVPNISVCLLSDGEFGVLVDSRMRFFIGKPDADALDGILRTLANSMAVAAGFSCFGKHSRVTNPYRAYPPPGVNEGDWLDGQ